MLDLLKKGATIEEICAATAWQQHSVRGFLSGQVGKRMGLAVESSKKHGARFYKLVSK